MKKQNKIILTGVVIATTIHFATMFHIKYKHRNDEYKLNPITITAPIFESVNKDIDLPRIEPEVINFDNAKPEFITEDNIRNDKDLQKFNENAPMDDHSVEITAIENGNAPSFTNTASLTIDDIIEKISNKEQVA